MSLITEHQRGEQLELEIGAQLTHWEIHVVSDEIRRHLRDCRAKKILLNLSAVSTIDSTGLGFIVKIWKQMEAEGRQVILCNLGEPLQNALKHAHLEDLIPVVDRLDAS